MKKLLVLVVVAVFLIPAMVQAQEPAGNWFFQGQGGVFSKYSLLKDGHVYGTASFKFVRLIYKDKMAVRGSYQDVEGAGENWNDYTGDLIFYTRNPKLQKFQIYLSLGAGLAHDPETKGADFVNGSFGGGIGLIIPVGGFEVLTEVQAKQIDTDWVGQFTSGMQVSLDF